jgi:hypothetical protein
VKARLAEWGATALAGSPADFAKFIADEPEKWGKVTRAGQYQSGVIPTRARRLTSIHYTKRLV